VRRVPVFPAVLVGAIAMVVLAFNIYNQYAFEVIIALGIIFMYLAYLGVTIPLLQQRLKGWPGTLNDGQGLFKLGSWGVVTNIIAVCYGAAMAINLAWPRDYFYGTKWYQQYGPILGITIVVVAGLALYYGRQQYHGTVLAEHRADVTGLLADAAVVVVAGGHVGVLTDTLHLFNIAASLRSPVIAWSAGAMALTDRIVLFNDRAAQGPGHPEVYGNGLSVLRDVVALPHASARLRLGDTPRMAVFARRFAPACCVLLENGTSMDTDTDGGCPPGTRVLAADGRVTTLEAA
jgi:hypothetical protein